MPVLTLPNTNASSLTVRAKALVFEDALSREMLRQIEQIAPSEATVLVTGETGTGKEIVARHIHELSVRRARPFVAINCGAFAETLVESELFGHERGAFTGALSAKAGWFEVAHGGTLFLDEIGDLPLGLQVKLLRVLQEREVVRVGARTPIPIDVRLIAATNIDLLDAVHAEKFREDLYYRLNVATVTIPPLRERLDDIPLLAQYFIDVYGHRLGTGSVRLLEETKGALLGHPWPGNIRELENVIHRALLVCREGRISRDDLRLPVARPREHGDPRRTPSANWAPPRSPSRTEPMERPDQSPHAGGGPGSERSERGGDRSSSAAGSAFGGPGLDAAFLSLFEQGVPDLHKRVEESLMRAAYNYCHRNQLQTARLLGISRNVVRARLIQMGELAGALRGATLEPPPAAGISAAPEKSDGLPPTRLETRLAPPRHERRATLMDTLPTFARP